MENKDLKKIYNEIFTKGEESHFSKMLESKGLPSEEKEILSLLDWNEKKVLDIGCGTGLFASEVAKRGADVTAIDYSEEAIGIAKNRHKDSNIKFLCLDVNDINEKYDVIVLIGTLEHMDKPFETLKLMKKHLKPKGSIVLTCPNWLNPRGYILISLHYLFDAPITLADINYLSPVDFKKWAKKLDMDLDWKTFDISRAVGPNLISDFKKRLPKVLKKTPAISIDQDKINKLIDWLEKTVINFDYKDKHIGASGLYYLKKR